ncbi:hypothetical protein A2Z53_02045 [Candidatus Giovannonibacteria bacterium RIFCSPHIGHO2_02_42_15]|uniref:Uncharacterized protein n=2 Tax=Candidatus Giovannoniibacteriota TaxID=1752738 RepID=A0A1F5VPT5_9BACT|nr:MAG: hypothetical protein UV11_C0045G0006 [Candidatus Giovannonibacteria bacterium GW2011_GWF2_42_19]OGF65379.1 MAG: hypothetical protein A2Z53_02045 [Candidatus Giovannonibacteria bacterium RIFCSPHIGHO2_02_42_15]HBB49336.1 hypothetical protein [Candidatus Nomurabacteria bacterium]
MDIVIVGRPEAAGKALTRVYDLARKRRVRLECLFSSRWNAHCECMHLKCSGVSGLLFFLEAFTKERHVLRKCLICTDEEVSERLALLHETIPAD